MNVINKKGTKCIGFVQVKNEFSNDYCFELEFASSETSEVSDLNIEMVETYSQVNTVEYEADHDDTEVIIIDDDFEDKSDDDESEAEHSLYDETDDSKNDPEEDSDYDPDSDGEYDPKHDNAFDHKEEAHRIQTLAEYEKRLKKWADKRKESPKAN